MNYNVLEIQHLKLKKAAFGFSEDAVNEVLEKICEDYNTLTRENFDMKEKLSVLNDGMKHYKTMEDSLRSVLLVAQQAAEDLKKNAAERAENITAEAHVKASQIVQDAGNQLVLIKAECDAMNKKITAFKIKYENVLKTELDILAQLDEKIEQEEPVEK